MRLVPVADITVEPVAPSSPRAEHILRAYYADVVSRYHGRDASDVEVDAAVRDDPSDDLVPPRGLLLVARQEDAVLGCVGLRLLPDGVGEVTRLYVTAEARCRGLGSRLLHELELAARKRRVSWLRLDTRSDLVEARRLYIRHGYREVAPFNDEPYAEHWLGKSVRRH